MLANQTALGRVGLPDDICGVVAFYVATMQNGLMHKESKFPAEFIFKFSFSCNIKNDKRNNMGN